MRERVEKEGRFNPPRKGPATRLKGRSHDKKKEDGEPSSLFSRVSGRLEFESDC